MKLCELEIGHFGTWHGLALEPLAEKVTVFYGPNEAGKSTLLQFIRGMLYGFAAERRRRYLPVDGLRGGGRLTLLAPQGLYKIYRQSDRTGKDDAFQIFAPNDALAEEKTLSELLAGVDEPTFNNVFAIGLRELQELGMLSDTEAAQWLYSLTSGVDRVSLGEVIGEVRAARERLLAPDERSSQIAQLWDRRERLLAEINRLSTQTTAWVGLEAERQELQARIDGLQGEEGDCARQLAFYEAALSLRLAWQECASLSQQLITQPVEQTVPLAGLRSLERLNLRLVEARDRYARLRKKYTRQLVQLRAISPAAAILRNAARIESLVEQQGWLAMLSQQIATLEALSKSDETSPREEEAQAGPGAVTERVWRDWLRQPARAWVQARRQWQEVEERLRERQKNLATVESERKAALVTQEKEGQLPTAEEAGARVGQLRRRLQLEQRVEQLERHRAELAVENEELLERQLLPVWSLAVLGCGFALAAMIVFGGWLWGSGGVTLAGFFMGGMGVCGGGVKFFLEKTAAQQLDSCRRQRELVTRQLSEATVEREQLDRQLPPGGGPLEVRLQEAEKQLARLDRFLPLEAQLQASQRELEAAQAESDRLGAHWQEAQENWQAALLQAGLPRSLKPIDIRRPSPTPPPRAVDSSVGFYRQQELGQARRQYELLVGSIRVLMTEISGAASDDPIEQINLLATELTAQRELAERRDRLGARLRAMRKRSQHLQRQIRRCKYRRRQLFAQAGVTSEEEFRLRAGHQEEHAEWTRRRAALGQQIAAGLVGRGTEEQLEQLLSTQNLDALTLRHEELRTQLSELRSLTSHAQIRMGEMLEKQRTLVADRSLAERSWELGQVETQLREAVEAWQVRAVAGWLLEQVRIDFERHRQPETLVEASGYLASLTEGRYVRIWTPLGKRVLQVDDAAGRAWPVEMLSRGTREQLFLSLRLALVALYGRRGIQLLVVLDDVLVNFDAGRARAAVAVLRDFAKSGHQLLIFTCHEHVWKMFKSLKLDARRLPASATPHQDETLPSEPPSAPPTPPKRAARGRKLKASPEPSCVVERSNANQHAPAEELPSLPPVTEETHPQAKPEFEYELAEYEPGPPPELPWEMQEDFLGPYEVQAHMDEVPLAKVSELLPEPLTAPPPEFSAPGARGWEVEFEEEWLRGDSGAA